MVCELAVGLATVGLMRLCLLGFDERVVVCGCDVGLLVVLAVVVCHSLA